jgi:hypothetical protein
MVTATRVRKVSWYAPGSSRMIEAALRARIAAVVSCRLPTTPGRLLAMATADSMTTAANRLRPRAMGRWMAASPKKIRAVNDATSTTSRTPMTIPAVRAGTSCRGRSSALSREDKAGPRSFAIFSPPAISMGGAGAR